MLRSRGRGEHRRHTPGSFEAGPDMGSYQRHSNQPRHAERRGRAQYEAGHREDRELEFPRASRYWRSRQDKKMYRE